MHPDIKQVFVFSLAALLFASCNKGSDPAYNDRPVVTGYLMAGHYPSVSIARQAGTSSGVATSGESLTTLQVFLSDDSATYKLAYVDSSYVDTSMVLQAGKTYHLSFLYNSKEVTASTTIPSRPQDFTQSVTSIELDKIDSNTFSGGFGFGFSMPDPVDLIWTNSDQTYYMMVATDTVSAPELVRDTSSTNFRPAFAFRNTPSLSGGTRLNTNSFEYFGTYQLVLYHLQLEYASLYETNSSSSSQSLTTPVTNVTNGFGIFTGINADTLYLSVIKK